jgi:hypothetical protein
MKKEMSDSRNLKRVMGLKERPDTQRDWPTVSRSQIQIHSDLNCYGYNNFRGEVEKFVVGLRWWPNDRTDFATDRR